MNKNHENNKTEVVTGKKAMEILECHKTKFYRDYFPLLNSFFDENNYRRLYLLNEVNALKEGIDKNKSYKIVR